MEGTWRGISSWHVCPLKTARGTNTTHLLLALRALNSSKLSSSVSSPTWKPTTTTTITTKSVGWRLVRLVRDVSDGMHTEFYLFITVLENTKHTTNRPPSDASC